MNRDEYIARHHTGDGWRPLIEELDAKLAELDPCYTIVQIKEKFGGLRFYFEPSAGCTSEVIDEMYELEHRYENESYLHCESCGSRDDVKTAPHRGYWIKTLCSACAGKEKA